MFRISQKTFLQVFFFVLLFQGFSFLEAIGASAVLPSAGGIASSSGNGAPVGLKDDDNDDDNDCGSGQRGEDDDESHNMGLNCLTSGCHYNAREHNFSIAGTVYNDVNGVATKPGATIQVVDSNGTTVDLLADSLGNFYYGTNCGTVTPPYTVSAHYGVATETMGSTTNGDCNNATCHGRSTQRIYVTSEPVVSAFDPETAYTDDTVLIIGKNFISGGTSVTFGGVAAKSVTVNTSKSISAVVGSGATGSVSVTTSYGTDSMAGFYFEISPPAITSFTPTYGIAGDTIIITGTNLSKVTSVSFGGTSASSFTLDSNIQITAVLAAGSSGSVAVSNSSATATKAGFSYLQPPTITNVTPTSSRFGQNVTITGTNFVSGAMAVHFGEYPALSVTVNSPTQITALMGVGDYHVTVTSKAGADRAAFEFIHDIQPIPSLHEWGNILLGILLLALSWIFFARKRDAHI